MTSLNYVHRHVTGVHIENIGEAISNQDICGYLSLEWLTIDKDKNEYDIVVYFDPTFASKKSVEVEVTKALMTAKLNEIRDNRKRQA